MIIDTEEVNADRWMNKRVEEGLDSWEFHHQQDEKHVRREIL
jgi:hypothetical protein